MPKISELAAETATVTLLPAVQGSTTVKLTPAQTQAVVGMFATRSAAASALIHSSIQCLQTAGYATVGDDGEGLYSRQGSNPGVGGFQSSDGAWWKLIALEPRPEQFGAKGDLTTDDLSALNDTISYAVTNVRKVVRIPGLYRVSATLSQNNSNITLRGESVSFSKIIGDLAVTPVVSMDGSGGTVFNSWVCDLKIGRAAGTVPNGSVGLYVNNFNYCGEQRVLCDRHALGRYLDCTVGGGNSIQWDGDTAYSTNIKTYDLTAANVAGIKYRFGEWGKNGGETYDRTAFIQIRETANDINFYHCSFIPRGPTPDTPGVVNFVALTNATGVLSFVDCDTENTSTGFTSDAGTAVIADMHVIGGRWDTSGGLFSLNAATRTISLVMSGVELPGGGSLLNPKWLDVSGCVIGAGFTLQGQTNNTNAQTDITSATVCGNILSGGNITLSASWKTLTVSGNNVSQGTITDSSTTNLAVNKIVANNGLNTGGWIAYTPTVTAGTGTFTSVAGTGAYYQNGPFVAFFARITVTTNGTAAADVEFTLPLTANASNKSSICGVRENDGIVVGGYVFSTTKALINLVDASYPAVDGTVLRVSGTYWAA